MERVLITGTSRGLGRALANEFTRRNYQVIASARNADDLKDLNVYKKLSLDVTNEDQVTHAAQDCGDIDVLINNAAYTVAGPVEIIPIEEIKREYETNVIAPLRLIRKFIPGMRQAGKGTIVNISTVADRFAPPFGGSYSSAKAALAMLSEALHFEVGHFGIRVLLIEPGAVKTDMPMRQKHYSSPEYQPLDEQMRRRAEQFFKEDRRTPADQIARLIADAVRNPDSGFRIPIGQDAEYMISLRSKLSEKEWQKSDLFKGLDW